MYESTEREIQERINETRERLGHTIEQIGDRVNPDRLQHELKARARERVDEVKSNVKEKARRTMRGVEHGVTDTGRGIWETIKENPIPAGMVGVGLAWLVANSTQRDEPERGIRERHGREFGRLPGESGFERERWDGGYHETTGFRGGPESYEAVSWGETEEEGRLSELKERGREAAERVRESAEHAVETAREVGSEATHRARETVEGAKRSARRVEHRIERSVHDNPLAAGAIAAAVGFAAGLIIPESRKEHEIMGRAHERFMDRAEQTVRRAGEAVRETARETAAESARRIVDEALPGGHGSRSSFSEPGR